jgi:hypothetical protein
MIMEKDPKKQEDTQEEKKGKVAEVKIERELDADNEVHKTAPDLIQKETHHLPVDDEFKKG